MIRTRYALARREPRIEIGGGAHRDDTPARHDDRVIAQRNPGASAPATVDHVYGCTPPLADCRWE